MASAKEIKNGNGITYAYQIRVYRGRDTEGKQLKPYSKTWRIPEGMKNPRTIAPIPLKSQKGFKTVCATQSHRLPVYTEGNRKIDYDGLHDLNGVPFLGLSDSVLKLGQG